MLNTRPDEFSTTDSKHSKRYTRWLIVALFLVIAVGCLTVLIPYNRQMKTIRKIEARGGLVVTDRTCPDWIRELIGSKRTRGFETISEVSFGVGIFELVHLIDGGAYDSKRIVSGPENSGNDDLDLLPGLTELRKLKLTSSDINDSGLDRLTQLKKLEELGLWSTEVTEEGLLNLVEQLPNLKKLYLNSHWFEPETSSLTSEERKMESLPVIVLGIYTISRPSTLATKARKTNPSLVIEFASDSSLLEPHLLPPLD